MKESGEVRGAERNGGDKLYAEVLAMDTWYTDNTIVEEIFKFSPF